jgi:hypothetical protein
MDLSKSSQCLSIFEFFLCLRGLSVPLIELLDLSARLFSLGSLFLGVFWVLFLKGLIKLIFQYFNQNLF